MVHVQGKPCALLMLDSVVSSAVAFILMVSVLPQLQLAMRAVCETA